MTSTPTRSRRLWLAAIFLFVIGDGITIQTRGPLLRSFEADFGVSEALLGIVAPAGTLGFVVAALVAGMLAGRIDIKRWIILGIGLTGLSLLFMSGAPLYWLFLVFLVSQGTAAGVVRGLDRTILSHLYPENRGRIFTVHSLAWAVGAVIGPLLVNWVLARGSWRLTYVVLGLFFLPLVGLIWWEGLPGAVGAERALSASALRQVLKEPLVIGMTLAITLVGITEGIVFTWLPFYASEFVSEPRANLLLTVYLVAYIPGRLLYIWLLTRVSSLPLALGLSLAFLLPLGVIVLGTTGLSLFLAAFVAGFFTAGLFPLVSTFGVEAMPEYTGPITALGTAGTYLGLAIGPVILGVIAESVGIVTAMPVTWGLAAAIPLVLSVTWVLAIHTA